MAKISAVCLFLFLVTTVGYGQLPSGNVFAGYSHLNSNDLSSASGTGLNGWEGSVEGKVFPFIGVVADFSGGYQGIPRSAVPQVCTVPPGGLPGGCILPVVPSSVSEYNFLFGPRASFKIAEFRPFVHALVGGAHVNESALGVAGSSTAFADALGGGVDYRFLPRLSWRVQVDALQTRFFSSSQTNLRISTGIVVRF